MAETITRIGLHVDVYFARLVAHQNLPDIRFFSPSLPVFLKIRLKIKPNFSSQLLFVCERAAIDEMCQVCIPRSPT